MLLSNLQNERLQLDDEAIEKFKLLYTQHKDDPIWFPHYDQIRKVIQGDADHSPTGFDYFAYRDRYLLLPLAMDFLGASLNLKTFVISPNRTHPSVYRMTQSQLSKCRNGMQVTLDV